MITTLPQNSAATPEPGWLTLLERLGLPIFLILFGCMIIWKLLPYVIEWFKTQTASAAAVKEAVPGIKSSLEKMAEGTSGNQDKLEAIDRKTNEILQRLPAK
jgi:hypothetical protein